MIYKNKIFDLNPFDTPVYCGINILKYRSPLSFYYYQAILTFGPVGYSDDQCLSVRPHFSQSIILSMHWWR